MHSNPHCLRCLQCMEMYQSGGMTEKLFQEGNMIHAVLSRDPGKRTALASFLSSRFLLCSNLSAVCRLPEDTLCRFITSRKVHSVPGECQQQQAMLGSPCFGKTFMTFVSFLRGNLPSSLKKLEAYFQLKELFRTRAGVLV